MEGPIKSISALKGKIPDSIPQASGFYICLNPDRVILLWGGGLIGHWGVIIHDGPKPTPLDRKGGLRVADDIEVAMDYD